MTKWFVVINLFMVYKMKNGYNKYKLVFHILFFVVLGWIIFGLLSYLFRPVGNNRKNICGFYAEEENTLDMVYIGGSACYYYWEPLEAFEQFGFTSYNFASDAMPPQIIKYCLKEVLKTQDPKLFVIDLRPFQYGDVYDEEIQTLRYLREAPLRNVIDGMKYSFNRFEMIENCVPHEEDKIYYHFDIAKYHSMFNSLFNIVNWKYIFNEYPSETKGFFYYDSFNVLETEDVSDVEDELKLADEMNVLFIDLLEYCKEEKLKVLFIVHPYTINAYDQKKYNYMSRVIDEYGQDYLNANDYISDMNLNFATDFYDGAHVNILGADKYTHFLGRYIYENYKMIDKRTDSKYESWNVAYEKWKDEVENARSHVREMTAE